VVLLVVVLRLPDRLVQAVFLLLWRIKSLDQGNCFPKVLLADVVHIGITQIVHQTHRAHPVAVLAAVR
jgi:hypothetical protein